MVGGAEMVSAAYFDWLYNNVSADHVVPGYEYRKLLGLLHDTEFTYDIPRDENRYIDGLSLRHTFEMEHDWPGAQNDILPPFCSVLEMMVALCIKMDASMADPELDDRFQQWFWEMISSMGLNGMSDRYFDEAECTQKIQRMLDRTYQPNGVGGLFTIKNCEFDLRKTEIWFQMQRYMNNLL